MREEKRVLVGLSGGVDSAVAAYLLKHQGYEVTGITMSIWDGSYATSGRNACYGPGEAEEIRETEELARFLEIPYHVFPCAAEYKELVLSYFKSEYLAGRTPNPCVRCNELIKFGLLPLLAERSGLAYDYFATGHYARIGYDAQRSRYMLKTGVDPKKDQSYFLYRLSQEQLRKLILPLGEYTKEDVRHLALNGGIPSAGKEESQDFYSGDFRELLEVTDSPGEIVLTSGRVVGTHRGFWNFTVGQRKGMGIAYSEPLYVVKLDAGHNRVIVGTRDEISETSLTVTDLNWISVTGLNVPMEVQCKIRSAQAARDARIEPYGDGQVMVTFVSPNDSIAPGQSAVFYDGDVVVGGGTIV